MQTAIAELTASIADQEAFGPPDEPVSDGGDTVLISVPVAGDADGPERPLRSATFVPT